MWFYSLIHFSFIPLHHGQDRVGSGFDPRNSVYIDIPKLKSLTSDFSSSMGQIWCFHGWNLIFSITSLSDTWSCDIHEWEGKIKSRVYFFLSSLANKSSQIKPSGFFILSSRPHYVQLMNCLSSRAKWDAYIMYECCYSYREYVFYSCYCRCFMQKGIKACTGDALEDWHVHITVRYRSLHSQWTASIERGKSDLCKKWELNNEVCNVNVKQEYAPFTCSFMPRGSLQTTYCLLDNSDTQTDAKRTCKLYGKGMEIYILCINWEKKKNKHITLNWIKLAGIKFDSIFIHL